MKIRFFVYGSLLAIILALSCVYKYMNNNIQKQEQSIRQQKENWLNDTARIEFHLARISNTGNKFWYYYRKGVDNFILYLEMVQEDIKNINL